MKLKEFLKQHGLEHYLQIFDQQNIDYDLLFELDEEDLKQLQMKIGDRKLLIKAIKKELESAQSHPNFYNEIQDFPSFLSSSLKEYVTESNPKLKLWSICDFFELFLRFVVITGLAQIRQQTKEIPPSILKELQARIEHPTLGKWIGMADVITKSKYVDTSLQKWVASSKKLETNGDDSIVVLRNQLAHGGGISFHAASQLLTEWGPRFEGFIAGIHEMKNIHLVVQSSENNTMNQLKGPELTNLPVYEPATPKIQKEIDQYLTQNSAVVLVNDYSTLSLWPLIFYDFEIQGTTPLPAKQQNVYVRRGELYLEYSPVGSSSQYQTKSDNEALNYFITMFKLDRKQEEYIEKQYKVRSFTNEILSDARKLLGRENELTKIKKAIDDQKDCVYWLRGNAGIGKSFLMAAIVEHYMQFTSSNLLVLPYRFKAGDDRCYRKEFILFAIERLNAWSGTEKLIDCKQSILTIQDLKMSLSSIKEGYKVLFVLDGFDEIPSVDMKLAVEICKHLQLLGTKWLCSGRTTAELEQIFNEDISFNIFPEGVPPMSKEDIFSMILEKIGPMRKKMIQHDIELENTIMNPFIEQIWRYSEGIPLYVTYVIGDILSNRIHHFDGKRDQLPPSIYAYHQELLKRCSISVHQQIIPRLIANIAILKEPLNFEALLELLIKEDYLPDTEEAKQILHECLTYVAPMLRTTSTTDGDGLGYLLYHTSLKQFLEDAPESRMIIQTARQSLIKLVIAQEKDATTLSPYMYRWGLTHLLEEGDKHNKVISGMLSSLPYLENKLQHQKLEYFFDDTYKGYLSVTNHDDGTSILQAFLKLIVLLEKKQCLTIETLHAHFIYRENKKFYKQLLKIATSDSLIEEAPGLKKLYPTFLSKLANFQRRSGQLDIAKNLLLKCVNLLKKTSNLKELSRVEYDIAYVNYLQGNYDIAYFHFENSKKYEKKLGDEVGYWMSTCVQYHTGQFNKNGTITRSTFKQILLQALPVFEHHAQENGNENAKRWVKNVYAHYFKVLYEEGNLEEAKHYYKKLKQNDWMLKFGQSTFSEFETKILILEKRWEEAAANFKQYLAETDIDRKSEAKSQDYLEYAKVLIKLRDYQTAAQIAKRGLACPIEFGNRYFQEDLKKVLNEINCKLKKL